MKKTLDVIIFHFHFQFLGVHLPLSTVGNWKMRGGGGTDERLVFGESEIPYTFSLQIPRGN
jgi:hypothetical protein